MAVSFNKIMAPKKSNSEAQEKKRSLYTLELSSEEMDKLQDLIESGQLGDWSHYEVAYSLFAYKAEKLNIVGYKSGKLVVSGKRTEEFVQMTLEPQITGVVRLGYDEVNHPEWFELHAGCDESGKGDVFGPLISACVIADGDMVRAWLKAGIADSKKISDTKIIKLDKLIRETKGVVVKTVFARMEKYNQLYKKFGENLNKLLAWYHGKAINEALKARKAPWGVLDQFSKQKLVDPYVKKEHPEFNLISRTKAESDPVVAAASIVARATYIREMKALSEQTELELSKGASKQVLEQAKQIFENEGVEGLEQCAKMHFKTAYEARGLQPPEKPKFVKR